MCWLYVISHGPAKKILDPPSCTEQFQEFLLFSSENRRKCMEFQHRSNIPIMSSTTLLPFILALACLVLYIIVCTVALLGSFTIHMRYSKSQRNSHLTLQP